MVVEKIIDKLEDFNNEKLKIDKVLLAHYELIKPHQLLKSQDGIEIAVSLPQGENLFPGAVLYKDEERIIAIDLIPEDVLEIRPKGNLQWGRAGFNIGNMHHPAYLLEDCILIPYDSVMERMIENLGVEYKRVNRKLEGMRANITLKSSGSSDHHHDHSHPHDHSHSHNNNHSHDHSNS